MLADDSRFKASPLWIPTSGPLELTSGYGRMDGNTPSVAKWPHFDTTLQEGFPIPGRRIA
jgi:hypothetical protein